MKIDYEKLKKIKELYGQFDEFDKKWLNSRGFYRFLHKMGVLSEEEFQQVSDSYDKLMAPVNQATEKVKAKVVDKALEFLWNHGIVKQPITILDDVIETPAETKKKEKEVKNLNKGN